MNYKHSSLEPIVTLLEKKGALKPGEISQELWKSTVLIHKYLLTLIQEGKIKKIWKAPHTRYAVANVKQQNIHLDFHTRKILDEVFLKFSPTGKRYEGAGGMQEWCQQRNLDFTIKSQLYIEISEHVKQLQDNCGLISATSAFWKDFEEKYLDEVYYADQYKYMEFWRGKLAELTFYGKQSQNKDLIYESLNEINPKLECLIAREDFDAIAITPWSIYRKNQLLGMLKTSLTQMWLPFINIEKYYENWISIPQKSLKTRAERIENAQNTIFVHDKNIKQYTKVLLIDDFVWSWATLNITAQKLKAEWVKEVTGFAFVGNLNLNYEVIREI